MAKAKAEANTGASVAIAIPFAASDALGYEAQQVQAGHLQLGEGRAAHIDAWLGAVEAATFVEIRAGLRKAGARLNNGREVFSNPDVIRWLMQEHRRQRAAVQSV